MLHAHTDGNGGVRYELTFVTKVILSALATVITGLLTIGVAANVIMYADVQVIKATVARLAQYHDQ